MRRRWRWLGAAVVVYASWLGMMALHELGHAAHAWTSGGRVVRVIFPPLGFSQTIVHPNPHPAWVVWGGPVWGAAVPVLACGAWWVLRRRVPQVLRFFTGFCLVANGAYLGVGWTMSAGDAADLLALGTPPWVMITYGFVCVAAGLFAWHRTRGIAGVA